jgi:hypothetical protein
MSATPNPVPGMPPGKPREELLNYFKGWPKGTRISDVRPTEWSAERDREDDADHDDGSAPAKRRKPASPEPVEMYEGEWTLRRPTTKVKAEWFVMTLRRWEKDPRFNDEEWDVTRLNSSKVLVIRVTG